MEALDPLLPPLPLIERRLTKNQRERAILRALQRLVLRVERQAADSSDRRPENREESR